MRLRTEIDPRIRAMLQQSTARARWSMDRPVGERPYNVRPRASRANGNVKVFDVFFVDNTHKSRDGRAGQPVYLGTAPTLEIAEEYIDDHAKGKSVFQINGFRQAFVGRPPTPDPVK